MNSNNARTFREAKGMEAGTDPKPLHTTLPLEDLIGLFASEIGDLVVYDSFEYENRQNSIHVFIGTPKLHKCHYKLNICNMEFGQLTMTRKTPFSDSEMNLLEGALGALIIHLNNAYAFQDDLTEDGLNSLRADQKHTSMSS
jgi:hypothetical protein